MKTVYYTATSIDGFIADPKNSLDWLFQFDDVEGLEEEHPTFINRIGAAAMGSTTYRWLLDHEKLLEHPEKWSFDFPVWVFSSREQPRVQGADVRFVRWDVAQVHAEMVDAARGKDVWLIGGGDLVGQFYDAGLLDEIILTIAPVTLGSGAPLLPRRIAIPPLRLREVRSIGGIFVYLTYDVPRPH